MVTIWRRLPLNRLRFSFVKRLKNRYLCRREETVNPSTTLWEEGERRTWPNMPYTPQHVANFFLDRADACGSTISPLKLLKLVYIAYGWYMALKGEQLFREKIEAWQHGPVIPSIYHEFKHFGSSPISGRAVTVDFSESKNLKGAKIIVPQISEEDAETHTILSKVWDSYRDFSAWQLRDMTHQDDTPWSRVYVEGRRGIQLNDGDIREHYVKRIWEYIEAASRAESA